MSRILRRPMFRGGPVSSYGTGIAHGLADGARVNLYRGGGTSYNPTIQNQGMVLGSDLINFIKHNPKLGGLQYFDTLDPKQYYKPTTYGGGRRGPQVTDSAEFLKLFQNYSDPDIPLIDPDKVDLETGTPDLEINEGEVKIEDTSDEYISPTMKMKQKEMNEGLPVPAGVVIDKGETIINDESTEDTKIEEMADKYFELMGGKKARGQDVSDMLLRFAGAEGDTTMEKFQKFAGEESKVKSRTEDLKEKATGFAIQQDAQTKLLDKKLDAQKEIADKNLIATIAKLDKDGQYKKKVDDIIDDRFGGDDTKRAEASRIALGDHATIEAAIYDATKGGMPMSSAAFDLLAASYTDGPMPTGDLAGMSGTFFVPGQMIIVEIINGVVDQNSTKDFSGKAKKS